MALVWFIYPFLYPFIYLTMIVIMCKALWANVEETTVNKTVCFSKPTLNVGCGQ